MLATKIQYLFCKRLHNHILLSHSSPLHKYSFLDANIHKLPKIKLEKQAWKQYQKFVSALKLNNKVIAQIKNSNYNSQQLQKVQKGQKGLKDQHQLVRDLATQFQELSVTIRPKINQKTIMMHFRVCRALMIVDIAIWGHLLNTSVRCFDRLSFNQQAQVIRTVHNYILCTFLWAQNTKNKFVYRQNYLRDLPQSRQMLHSFFKHVISQGDIQIRAQSLNMLVFLIQKISKAQILNFHKSIIQFIEHQQKLLSLAQMSSFKVSVDVMKLMSLIGYRNEDILQKLQTFIIKKYEKNSLNYSQKINLVSRLLFSWSYHSRHNPQLYTSIVHPIILQLLSAQTHKQNFVFSSFLYNLVASGVQDRQMIQLLIARAQKLPIDNIYLHIVQHYISIKDDTMGLSAYAHCYQNPTALQIVQKHGKAYLNCMTRAGSRPNRNTYKTLTQQANLGHQSNPPQAMWFNILSLAFQKLSKRYPHQTNSIHHNFNFCVFDIDTLMMLGGKAIAVQFVGTHYAMKDQKGERISGVKGKIQGKKMLKQTIIKAYGISILHIDSTEVVERNIGSFRLVEGGASLIYSRICQFMEDL